MKSGGGEGDYDSLLFILIFVCDRGGGERGG